MMPAERLCCGRTYLSAGMVEEARREARRTLGQTPARYLITQLDGGVAPEGSRVVSADNLKLTWQPQVQSAPNQWYALGWGVGALL